MIPIPTLSLDALNGARGLATLDTACREWGVIHLSDHGIEPTRLRQVRAEIGRFFALPIETKRTIERTAENPWGWYDRELTKNVRDWKEILDLGPTEGASVTQWPDDLPGFREVMERFTLDCERIAATVLEAIARNLGTDPVVLTQEFAEGTSFLRLNHYPPCPDPAPADSPTVPSVGRLGIGHHTDAGAITVLLQDDRPGLQVEKDGRWFDVGSNRDSLLVHLGDIVQVWSNDRYRAPVHRVLAHPTTPRSSAPYFYNPSYRTEYAPLKSVCREVPPRYRPIRWAEFRAARAAGDYADLGEEIQISHFRIEP